MPGRIAALALVIASSIHFSADLSACGDKFLRMGRSARFKGYAAVHPASILIYKSATSTAAGVKEFEALLKRAGHKPLAVEHGAALAPVVAAGRYDVVIADYADTEKVKEALASAPSKPGLLPILYKPTKAVAAEAEKEYHCLIKPHAMNKYDALAEIDHLLDLRVKESAAVK
jgi:hypothetical protein